MASQIIQAANLPSITNNSVTINNTVIAYKDPGAGRVILCLHAIGHSSSDFESLYQLPMDKYRVIALDFPGHGNSGKPAQPVSASYYKTVVDSFITQLNLKDIVVVGNSMGGATAIRLACNNSNVKALALADPGGLDKRGFMAPFFLGFMVRFFKAGQLGKPAYQSRFERYYKLVLPTAAANKRRKEITDSAYKIAPLLVEAWQSFGLDEEDLRPMINAVSCPVLFTWGTKDKVVQLSRCKSAIEKFRYYTLIKYPIGHTPYIECPDDFLSDFKIFLKQLAEA